MRHVKNEKDYFYKVIQILLSHKDIDVNALVIGDDRVLSRMAWEGYNSLSGIKLLLEHPNIHVCKSESAFKAVKLGRPDLLELIFKNPSFNVNKKCERCKSRLPITCFESPYNFESFTKKVDYSGLVKIFVAWKSYDKFEISFRAECLDRGMERSSFCCREPPGVLETTSKKREGRK